MFFDSTAASTQHGSASFWLDVTDRVIKFLALLVGAAWTWMHYLRSRTYAQKLELGVEGRVLYKQKLYLELLVSLKNLGASRHTLRKRGTSCSVWAVMHDLSEFPVLSESVFSADTWIEPGESIEDSRVLQVDLPLEEIIWLRVGLRVISGTGEWNLTRYIRVEIVRGV
jgi:hypothetical protein